MKRFFFGRRRNRWSANKPSWMIPISHGHHVVEHHVIKGGSDDSNFDSVVIQREQMDHTELWYFGIFDTVVGDEVTKYMQSHFFGKKLKEVINQILCQLFSSIPLYFAEPYQFGHFGD